MTEQPNWDYHVDRWKPITGYEDLYLISQRGRVWRLDRYVNRVHTGPYLQRGGIMADWQATPYGHRAVYLVDVNGRRKKYWIHRLVAEHFIPNPEGLPWVLHGPAGPSENYYTNLRWGNQSENEKDKLRHKIVRQEQRHEGT